MEIKDWFKFTDDLKQAHPEAEAVINAENHRVINEYNELRVNASIQSQYGKPIDPDRIISDRIDQNLPEFEKRFFAHYEEWSIDTPEQNRFDSVRHLFPVSEFERGDETLNSYAERFQNIIDQHKQKETAKESILENIDIAEIPNESKDYEVVTNDEFGSITQKYLGLAFRDSKDELTVRKETDMDRD